MTSPFSPPPARSRRGWRGYPLSVAQVPTIFGAGTHYLWRRSVFWQGTCATGMHWKPFRGAGPHFFFGPAPEMPRTCAKRPGDLRHKAAVSPLPSARRQCQHSHVVLAKGFAATPPFPGARRQRQHPLVVFAEGFAATQPVPSARRQRQHPHIVLARGQAGGGGRKANRSTG